jgi:O-antigen biosynthesis protein
MNALTSHAPAPVDRASATPEGAVLLACPVGRGGLVLFGWHTLRLPRQGAALLGPETNAPHAAYRLHAWAHTRPGAAWYVAALQRRDTAALPPEAPLTLLGQGRAPCAMGTLPAANTLPEIFATSLAQHAATAPGPLALFLAELCAAAPRSGALRALLQAYLSKAAIEDGVVEIAGLAEDTLMLQGWGNLAQAEDATALLIEDGITRHKARLAAFARSDIAAPTTGAVALLEEAGALTAERIRAVHLVAGTALVRRAVLPQRQLLGASETGGHLGDILPRLAGAPETLALARRMLRPRFTGADTLATLSHPVRAAIDLAAVFEGAGIYLSGWLLDPARHVRSVHLCAAGGLRVRLDDTLSHLPRPDVAAAFGADPRFAGAEAGAQAGLSLFAPLPTLGAVPEALHLDLELADGVAFLPITPARGTRQALLRRALESIDLHRPGAHAAIAAQLGPLLQALAARPAAPAQHTTRRRARPGARALLLPMPDATVPAQTALSFLLSDPLAADEALVLVCPPDWTDAEFARLDTWLRLYRAEATVLHSAEALEWTAALDLAAAATEAPVLACLGQGLRGRAPGWRALLATALAPDTAMAFPTTLYEDLAVRSIGVARLERVAGAPWARAVRPFAGRPAAFLESGLPANLPRWGGLPGALVRRAAWQACGGFAGAGVLAETHAIGFAQRLEAAGLSARWLPAAQVFAPDAPEQGGTPHWRQVARLADGWLLSRTLSDPTDAMEAM